MEQDGEQYGEQVGEQVGKQDSRGAGGGVAIRQMAWLALRWQRVKCHKKQHLQPEN